MPKKKTLWKREVPCPVCETPMVNYQFMTKSQTIVLNEWMVPHTEAIGGYEEFPDTLKTTICPGCLTGSNEYSYGCDDYARFYKSPSKNNQIIEYFKQCDDNRAKLLAAEFGRFEQHSALLDERHNRPKNTRTKATIDKIWGNRDQYGVPFFNLIFQEPRDLVTVLVLFAMDRYFQKLRICFNHDVEPDVWDYEKMKEVIETKFNEESLSMKAAEPRFYYLALNHIESVLQLERLNKELYDDGEQHFQDMIDEHWREAYTYMKFSKDNDDIGAIPLETKDGGLNFLLAKLHIHFDAHAEAEKCIRFAKNYADNRMKSISSKNQQNYVNWVDDLHKEFFKADEGESEGEDAAE